MKSLHRSLATLLLGVALSSVAYGVEPIRVANSGMGGHNSRQGLSRLGRDVLAVKPQHLVIYFGMNDACNPRKAVPVDEFSSNLQTMIDRSQAVGVRNIVLVTPNPVVDEYLARRAKGHPCQGKFQVWLDSYDAAIRNVAKRNRLPIADLRKLCDAHGGAKIVRESLIRNKVNADSEDGVHLTREGYRRMAEMIAAIVKKTAQPGDVVVCFGDSITYGAAMKGAGTAYGETYPAWLWLYLNRHVGATKRETPPVFENADPGNLVRNGNFEISEDGAPPVFWRSYKASDRIGHDQPFSGAACVHVVNKYPAPHFFWHTPDAPVSRGKVYRYEFAVRGAGAVRPFIRQLGRGKLLGVLPAEDEDAWIQATGKWQVHGGRLALVKGTKRILVMFQVKGDVSLDAVSIRVEK